MEARAHENFWNSQGFRGPGLHCLSPNANIARSPLCQSRPFLLPLASAPAASVGRPCTHHKLLVCYWPACRARFSTALWVHVAESCCCCQGGERRRSTARTRPTPRRWWGATCAACSSAAGRQQELPSRSCSWPAPSPSTGWCAHADRICLCALRLLRRSTLILLCDACRSTTSRTVRAS